MLCSAGPTYEYKGEREGNSQGFEDRKIAHLRPQSVVVPVKDDQLLVASIRLVQPLGVVDRDEAVLGCMPCRHDMHLLACVSHMCPAMMMSAVRLLPKELLSG